MGSESGQMPPLAPILPPAHAPGFSPSRSMVKSTPPAPAGAARLLIVDDHPLMRRGLAQLLSLEADLKIQAQAGSSAEALALLHAQPFELVISDVSLSGVSGLDLLKDIRILWPRLPVLMLSMHDEMLYAERVLRAGARGYVSKQSSADAILAAIRRVLSGQIYVSEEVSGRILGKLVSGEAKNESQDSIVNLLSNRELEVLQFIGRGRGTRDIAAEMHVSVKTVETYRAHIKEKLKLKSAPELMRFAVNWVGHQGQN